MAGPPGGRGAGPRTASLSLASLSSQVQCAPIPPPHTCPPPPSPQEGARTRGATFAHLASWWSEQPALLAGLQRTKGAIEPGRDADLCVWNPDGEVRPLEEGTHHRHAGTPYDGRTLHGRVRATFLRGRVAFDDHHGLPADACGRTVLLTA